MPLCSATDADRTRVLEYLEQEPEFNLFIIGDILKYGMKSEDIDVYWEQDGGAIRAVLLRFRDSYVPYTHAPDVHVERFCQKLNEVLGEGAPVTINGKWEVITALRPQLQRAADTEHEQHFAVCRGVRVEPRLPSEVCLRLARPEDAEEVSALLDAVFSPVPDRNLRTDIERGHTEVAGVWGAQGELRSVAMSVAETNSAAMIIGVGTLPVHRKCGYASACTHHLVKGLAARNKSACLFFHNPEAGAIYHRIGFEDIGQWRMLKYGQ